MFAVCLSTGHARPLDGVYARQTDVPADGLTMTKRFRSGERASVQAVHTEKKQKTTVHIAVYDSKDNLVAEDTGRDPPSSDMVAVIWYPPRDAEYRIVIRNMERAAARYFVSIR
jgi:hypothetical protein